MFWPINSWCARFCRRFGHPKSHPICHLIYHPIYLLKNHPSALGLLALERGGFATDQGMLEHSHCDLVTGLLSAYVGNLAVSLLRAIKHMAHNLIRKAPGKDSLRLKRKVAAWDDDFLASIVST